ALTTTVKTLRPALLDVSEGAQVFLLLVGQLRAAGDRARAAALLENPAVQRLPIPVAAHGGFLGKIVALAGIRGQVVELVLMAGRMIDVVIAFVTQRVFR